MQPILFRTPWFFVFGYTVALGFGVAVGAGVIGWLQRRPLPAGWLDSWLVLVVGGTLGGRLGFWVANWGYFQERPSELWQPWRGGFGYHAALLGAAVALWGWQQWRQRPLLPLLNTFAAGLALLSAFGWLACWLEGCAYGAETTLGWLAADLPDAFGVFAVRYRTQLLGAAYSLLAFGVIFWWQRRRGVRGAFALVLLLLSLGHGAVGLLRGDEAPMLMNVRLDLWLDGMMVLIGAILLQYEDDLSHS